LVIAAIAIGRLPSWASDGKLHEAILRFHEKTRQIDRIVNRHGLHEDKLEERRGEFSEARGLLLA
jgi:hypothetical protein